MLFEHKEFLHNINTGDLPETVKWGQIFQIANLLIGLKSICGGDVFIQSEIEKRKTVFI